MLPRMDGFGVCELIRQRSQVPILMLTALDGEETQLRGFKLDIDDYVTKPFSMPVLLEKIRVILRRSDGMDGKRETFAGGRLLDLTAREFDLLRTFLEAPGRVFTREMLLVRLWGYDFYGDGRVVDTHIKNLRRKLGQDYIETVKGVGYRAAKETGREPKRAHFSRHRAHSPLRRRRHLRLHRLGHAAHLHGGDRR